MPETSKPIVFAVRDMPIELFGGKHGRQTRKFVLLTLATHADSDGSNCYPSIPTLARECGMNGQRARGCRKVIQWLTDNGFLRVEQKASPLHTNRFTIVLPDMMNASGHDERYRTSCPEVIGMMNASGQEGDERYRTPNLPLPTKKLPTKKREAKARSRSTSLPDNFSPRTSHQELAAKRGMILETEFQKFIAHHISKGSTFRNWDAALTKWLLNAAEYNSRSRVGTSSHSLAGMNYSYDTLPAHLRPKDTQ